MVYPEKERSNGYVVSDFPEKKVITRDLEPQRQL